MAQGSKYKVTEEDKLFVCNCIMAGRSFEAISESMNICTNTLKKHFKFEIVTSLETLCGNAARCISEAVNAGNVDAAKFVLSRKAGWSEKHDVTHAGDEDHPIRTVTKIVREIVDTTKKDDVTKKSDVTKK